MEDETNNLDEVEVVEGETLKFGKERGGISSKPKKKKVSSMAGFIMKLSHGYIKTEVQANIVLIVVAIVFFVFSFLFLF